MRSATFETGLSLVCWDEYPWKYLKISNNNINIAKVVVPALYGTGFYLQHFSSLDVNT